MDTILAEQGLRLSYLRDPSTSDAFDPCRILDDVCDDGMAGAMLPWQNGLRMAASDHLVVATGSNDGRCFGVVAASDMATEREPFLFLDAAYLAPMVRDVQPAATHAGIRHAARRRQRRGADHYRRLRPDAVLRAQPAGIRPALHARRRCFPPHRTTVVIDLGMASLARRIMRVVRPASRHATTGMFRSTAGTGCRRRALCRG